MGTNEGKKPILEDMWKCARNEAAKVSFFLANPSGKLSPEELERIKQAAASSS